MINGFSKVSIVNDKTKGMFANLKKLSNVDVLVGVPEDKSSRGGEIDNAQLVYIHTHGIRTSAMRKEMNENMMGGNNMPFSPDYEKFSNNLNQGMSYSAAYQMYLHEHGSPAWQSPPRPIIEPAIEDPENKEHITEQLERAAGDALDGNFQAMDADLNNAGMVAQNAVRDWFTNPKNNWAPNSPITIHGSKPDKNGNQFIKGKGSDNPLIDKGELRKSISYVVRKKD